MTIPDSQHHRLVGRLSVDTESGAFLGDTRIRLLEAIDRHGSISRAARDVPLSYRAAWDALEAMNKLAGAPLVERSSGGRRGGGTRLTDYGRRLVALFRAVDDEYRLAVERLSARLGDGGAGSVDEFQGLLRRMSMRTSARNQFVGRVSRLGEVGGGVEVGIRIGDGVQVVAQITRASVDHLALGIGREVSAFVKAPAVGIATTPAEAAASAAHNQLWGEVSRVDESPLSRETTIVLAGGRTVTSVVARDRPVRPYPPLLPGMPVAAVFPSSAVVLAVFD